MNIYNKYKTAYPFLTDPQIIEILDIERSNHIDTIENLLDRLNKINVPLMERVFTFEGVLVELGYKNDDRVVTLNMWENLFSPYEKMKMIYECFNEGWKPNWSNDKERKYYPWFEYKKEGFVLDYVNSYYVRTNVSSHLCSHSEDIIKHICKYFLKEYNEYLKY